MYKGQTVAVVITAYNEEGFVGEVIETQPSFVDRTYVVDDGSTDGTWAEIQRHSVASDGGRAFDSKDVENCSERDAVSERALNGRYPGDGPSTGDRMNDRLDDGRAEEYQDDTRTDDRNVVPIKHAENKGVGAAVKTGYRAALADEMDVIALMDGDGQMDPAILDRIIDPVVEGRADYAKGNRLLSREHTEGMSAWRRFGNATLTVLTKVASGYWKTMDPQNGYTAISRRALAKLDLDDLYDGYGFLNDLLVTLNTHSMRVADVEMKAVYADETSTISYSSFIPRVSGLLLTGFLWRLKVRYLVYDFHPLVLLYLVGAAGSAVAIAQVALFLTGVTTAGSLLAGLIPVALLSVFALSMAMSFDVMNNEHLEIQELIDDASSHRRRDRPPVVQVSEQSD